MKHFFLLSLGILCSFTQAFAYDAYVDNIYYNLDTAAKTAEVTSSGRNYQKEYSGDIVIPSTVTYNGETYTVTGIGEHAFYYPENTNSITLPSTITYIGSTAFYACLDMVSICIPQSVTRIENDAFYSCSALKEILVDENNAAYKSVGGVLYSKDMTSIIRFPEGLTADSFVLPGTVKFISPYAFFSCQNLMSVTLPESVTEIGDWSFNGCRNLVSVNIPSRVTRIGHGAFIGCKFTSISIPNSVTTIAGWAFASCPLTSIDIPESVTKIGEYAFSLCPLTSVKLSKSVTSLGNTLFFLCSSLKEIQVDAANPAYTSVDGVLFDKNITTLLCYPEGKTDSQYSVPNTVTTISDSTFYKCEKINNITFSESLKSIGNYAFVGCTRIRTLKFPRHMERLGDGAFKDCTSLQNIYINFLRGVVQTGKNRDTFPFNGVKKEYCWLYVPEGLKERYKTADFWKNFSVGHIRGQYHLIDNANATSYPEPGPTTRNVWGRCFKDSLPVREIGFEGLGQFRGQKLNASMDLTSLEPGKENTVTFYAISQEGYKETKTITFTQPALVLNVLHPKGVSGTSTIVTAETNIEDSETNVGFQWKKYGAPENLKPSEGYAAIYDGKLEGVIKNLQTTSYYNVRAFYKSSAGNYYYSDWTAFDPSDFSYFEPTVHTYEAAEVTDVSAKVRGYVLAGTDDIVEQGFEYWLASSAKSNAMRITAERENNVSVVISTGQVMTATLTDLRPSSKYRFRSFVTTTSGTTYGEEQTFTTNVGTGIGDISSASSEPTVIGYYDLSGRRHNMPQKGLNIIRYSDGSARKVSVK